VKENICETLPDLSMTTERIYRIRASNGRRNECFSSSSSAMAACLYPQKEAGGTGEEKEKKEAQPPPKA
jgi:hypothetical protein